MRKTLRIANTPACGQELGQRGTARQAAVALLKGGINRLPMERTAGVAALYKKARAIAGEIGWKLEEAAVGGGSDGNFTAGMGIPTLDGMGGVGDGAHAVHEFVVISELPRRALLLTGMIESV